MRENVKNDNKDEFLDFDEFILYVIFKIFNENSHYPNGHFQKNPENYIHGDFPSKMTI